MLTTLGLSRIDSEGGVDDNDDELYPMWSSYYGPDLC